MAMENMDSKKDFTPTVIIEQKEDKEKKRGLLTTGASLAVVAAMGLGGTLAYFTYTTNLFQNMFTTDKEMKITADTLEPAWEAGKAAADHKTASDGSSIPVGAAAMKPSSHVDKDPFVANTSKNGNKVFAGLMLQFYKWEPGSGSAAGRYVPMSSAEVDTLLAVYSIGGANPSSAGMHAGTNWTQIVGGQYSTFGLGHANANGAMYFYYRDPIAALTEQQGTDEKQGTFKVEAKKAYSTENLFTNVQFMNATDAQIQALKTLLASGTGSDAGSQPGWKVDVKGGAIDAEGFTDPRGAEAFIDTLHGVSWKSVLDAAASPDAKSGVRA